MFKNYFLLIFGKNLNSNINSVNFIEEAENNEEGFGEFYDQNIKPIVVTFEKKRINDLKKLRSYLFLGILSTILVTYLCIDFESKHDLGNFQGAFFAIGALLIAYLWYLVTSTARKFKDNIKSQIFRKIFSFFDNINYKSEGNTSVNQYKEFDILPFYNHHESEDSIYGAFQGAEFSIEELLLQNMTRNHDGKVKIKNVFDGVAILLKTNKNFNGKTLIRKELGLISNFFKLKFGELEKIRLEDPEFNKIFQVYSSDKVQAGFLLTTSFMQKLLNISKIFGKVKGPSKKKRINASFSKHNLLITLKTKQHLFEITSIFKPEDFIADCKILIREINVIFDIIEELNSDHETEIQEDNHISFPTQES